jgi:hypothetical protein
MKMVDPTRPTIYWDLGGANLGGTNMNPSVNLMSDLGTTPVNVGGLIVEPFSLTPITSQLTIQSDMLTGDVGGNASFFWSQLTGPSQGQFQVPLPPGSYWIRADPVDQSSGLSITDTGFQVPSMPSMGMGNCVCGRNFPLSEQATLAGPVKTASGAILVGTTVSIAPSQPLPRPYLADIHNLPPLLPRTTVTTTDNSGHFSLKADLGTLDLTIQTDPSTNFPWLVFPQLTPGGSSSSGTGGGSTSALPQTFTVTNPVFLNGVVRDPRNVPIPNAEIDAWFPVRTSLGALTGTVVKIAMTTTDANGTYTLVLPSSVPAAN